MRSFRSLLATVPFLSLLAACGDGGTGTGAGGQTTSTAPSICATDARATVYAVGLSAAAMDGTVKVTFVDAQPAPPAKGTNTFTVDVADGHGAPIDGAAVTVKPFMPDHGHGPSVVPTVKVGSQAGRYDVTDVELFMPGIWDVTFTVTPSGGAAESVKFTFCVDG